MSEHQWYRYEDMHRHRFQTAWVTRSLHREGLPLKTTVLLPEATDARHSCSTVGPRKKLPKFCMTIDPPTLIECFKGHTKPVRTVAFEAGSRQLATAGDDRVIMVWNLTPPIRAFKFIGHSDIVSRAAYCPTQSLLATVSFDKSIRLWTPNVHGESIFRKIHQYRIRDLSFSSDGRSIVTCSDDKSIKVFDTNGAAFKMCFTGHSNWVRSARLSPDGRLLASASDDGSCRIWDTRTMACIQAISSDTGLSPDTRVVRWSPDGTSLATGGTQDVQVWDVRSSSLLQHYSCHSSLVTDLAFHPTGKVIVSTGADGTIRVQDLLEGRSLYTVRGHDGGVNCVDFCPDGSVFATGGDDGRSMLFELNV